MTVSFFAGTCPDRPHPTAPSSLAWRREHPWQETAAGKDRARPVDVTLPARPPAYAAHEVAARAKQAWHAATGERAGAAEQ